MTERKSLIARFLGGVWRAVDTGRRVAVNLLFLVIAILVVAALLPDRGPEVPDTAVLVVAPRGRLVEQLTGDPLQRAVNGLFGIEPPETLLKDVVDGIEAARNDDRIQAMLLDLNRFGGASLSKLQEVRAAILDFKATGKTVIAAADFLGQSGYHLATGADEIFVRRDGGMMLEGYGSYRTYFKDGIDRLGVDVHVFKAGEYKSYPEPYERDSMSDEAKAASLELLGDLWQSYLDDVASARGLTVEVLSELIENADEYAVRAGGDAAKAALDAGLIDHIGPRDWVRDRMVELVGEDEDTHTFHQIGLDAYLETLGENRFGAEAKGDLVGVLVARGEILFGSQPPGTVGGRSTSKLVRTARHDDDIKALVIRVDSPGGISLAAEEIRREIELVREAGKPVVVSMGGVAASGGYHISMASDEIWCSPNTVTGSIGVFAMFPTFQRPMEEFLGMRVDGVGTTPFADALRLDRELSERVRRLIQSNVEFGYWQFVEDVAGGRGMTAEEVDAIARGRVWSGRDALDLGLVDKLGTLDDAIASAAALADLGDDFEVKYIEQGLDPDEQLLVGLLGFAGRFVHLDADRLPTPPRLEALTFLERQATVLSRFNDPSVLYEYAFWEVD
jgi:protease-4